MSELVSTRIRTTAAKLGLPHLAESLNQYAGRADEAKMGYLDFLNLVLSEELAVRVDRRFRQGLLLSKRPHHKTLDEYDFAFQPELDPRKVRTSPPSPLSRPRPTRPCWVRPGSARPTSPSRSRFAACRADYSVYFTTLDDMVRQLKVAEAAGRLNSKLCTYLRHGVLSSTKSATNPLNALRRTGVPGDLEALRKGLDHPDVEQDLQRMGAGVR
ncbi:ATP-binding protein [Streptomyces sp. NBC_00090]